MDNADYLIKMARSTTQGSTAIRAVRKINKDKPIDPGNIKSAILVFNLFQRLPNGHPKNPAYGLPGGKIGGAIKRYLEVYGLTFQIPPGYADDETFAPLPHCESSLEGAIRELFEETGAVINTGNDNLRNDLISIVKELQSRKEGMTYHRLAAEAYVKMIHDYAQAALEQNLLQPAFTRTFDDRPPTFVFDVDPDLLMGLDELGSQYDVAKTTNGARWFSGEDLNRYVAAFQCGEEINDENDRPLKIYQSTLVNLGWLKEELRYWSLG